MKPKETPGTPPARAEGTPPPAHAPASGRVRREGSAAPRGRGGATPASGGRTASAGMPIWLIGLLFAGVCFLGVRWTLENAASDDFRAARQMVAGYERGKDPTTINYNDPLYAESMKRLANVPATSPSAAEAARMLADLEAKQRAFDERLKEGEERMQRTLAAKEARQAEVLAIQERTTGLDPGAAARLQSQAAEAPGCQDEERHAHHGAKGH